MICLCNISLHPPHASEPGILICWKVMVEDIFWETKKSTDHAKDLHTWVDLKTLYLSRFWLIYVVSFGSGDPTVYQNYWVKMGEKTTIVIRGWQSMSYFSDIKSICWFLEPELGKQIVRLHKIVGNAKTEGCHIVVGTGSSQLYLAAFYLLYPLKKQLNPLTVSFLHLLIIQWVFLHKRLKPSCLV